MPEISSFYGIVIYMYMSEHNPPHQDELLANWERLGKSEAPMKITPLQ